MTYLDSRDLISELERLEGEDDLDEDDTERRAVLREVCDEGASLSADWQYGETLIPEDEFVDYAQELAEDIGAIDRDASWPLSYIDWTQAADALREDYSELDFDGRTYLIRS